MPGRVAIDADAMRRELDGQGLRKHHDRGLARAIAGYVRNAALRRARGRVHDRPGAAFGDHAPRRLARPQEDAVDVDAHEPPPVRERDVRDGAHRNHAGVIDDEIGRAERGVNLFEQGEHRGFVCHVGGNGERRPADPPPLGGEPVRVDVRHRDTRAVGDQTFGDGEPDAARGAGDDRDAALMTLHG